ncbi:hypothetical protein TTHERM_000069648 (macronuclear) [Tetrahymena thermophila SB210]|uniref:Uncharacterized protein n=1 Tax=Tetrahymena thermophila (strain SB210) TaxID=312017 RepID=W7XF70_TETTS|nr:hypothetical protein TTHERM_000069648 [Tetrahymena thermophila SB210]EWS76452.1 hypothetical protein TTHERM_000069648 [Tetrahymena thermophila SB210]|eukprot:XP_012651012.1 hypothetical protein TTHERM_000069648 [Tetrahymena thermophila SB210]
MDEIYLLIYFSFSFSWKQFYTLKLQFILDQNKSDYCHSLFINFPYTVTYFQYIQINQENIIFLQQLLSKHLQKQKPQIKNEQIKDMEAKHVRYQQQNNHRDKTQHLETIQRSEFIFHDGLKFLFIVYLFQGVDYKYIMQQYGISKAHFYRMIKNPEPKKQGRRQKYDDEHRKAIYDECKNINGIDVPVKRNIFMQVIKQMENKRQIPKASNHVKYPEYNKYLENQRTIIQEEYNLNYQQYSHQNYSNHPTNSSKSIDFEIKSFSFECRYTFFDLYQQDDLSSNQSLKKQILTINSKTQIYFIYLKGFQLNENKQKINYLVQSIHFFMFSFIKILIKFVEKISLILSNHFL